jgi:hypothetical protein
MSSQSLRVTSIPVQTVAYGSITGSFVAFGAAMPEPICILKIQNTTNADMYISFDGTTKNDVVVAESGMVLDFAANKSVEQGRYLPQGTIIYIEYVTAPTYGNVYLSAYYAY